MTIVAPVPAPKLAEQWFVEVLLEEHDDEKPVRYAIGPYAAWSDAFRLAKAWEMEHGDNTTRVESRVPRPTLAKIDPVVESARV